MKKLLVIILTICFMFTLAGCGSKEKKKNENELYLKAVAILDEFKDDNRVKDFRKAYDLLIKLPSDKDDLIDELQKVNDICKKYSLKLSYGNQLLHDDKYGFKINEKRINVYRNSSAFRDAKKLLEKLVYPALFEKYGQDALCIKGLSVNDVRHAITSSKNYNFLEKKELPSLKIEEIWRTRTRPKTNFYFTYHKNNLVTSISFPIVRNTNPLSKHELESFYTKTTPDTRKQILSNRIPTMIKEIDLFSLNCEFLENIFSDNELFILNNYLSSLTIEEIWKNDMITKTELKSNENPSYYSASIYCDFKENNLEISYTPDYIRLKITGKNRINPLSHRWSILKCGLFDPTLINSDIYYDKLHNNITANKVIYDGVYDLDANAAKYANHNAPTGNQIQTNNSSPAQSDFTIETTYYTLKTPATWSDDCTYKIHKTDNHSYSLTLYEKLSHQKNGDGQLFTIVLYPGFEDYTTLPDYNYLGKLKIKELGSFNVVITYPTDITFSEEYVEKYNDMKEAIPYILKNITFKDGYTFSNQPNK